MYPWFNSKTKFAVIDYETFSEADIKKTSSYIYSKHPSTEIMCLSFRVGTLENLRTAPVRTWAPLTEISKHRKDLRTKKIKKQLLKILLDPDIILVAHNSLFEQAITRNVITKFLYKELGVKKGSKFVISPSRYLCTAALAQVYALPRSLEGACAALKLEHAKDKEGHRIMLKLCKPRKPSKNNPSKRFNDPQDFNRMVEYCESDIYAETDLFLFLDPLIKKERLLWEFDQRMNWHGIGVDIELVKKISKMIAEEKSYLTKKLIKLTGGKVQTGGQRDKLLLWLKKNGLKLSNLQAKTVEDAIDSPDVSQKIKTVLTIRQGLNKTSLKKYNAFLNQTDDESIIRFLLNFHAASTGRWGGMGLQPHNFPRGNLKHKEIVDGQEIEHDLAPIIADLISDGADLNFIRMLVPDVMDCFSSLLRTMIVPHKGKQFYSADFASIEVRVLFWIAEHAEGVKAFFEGRDQYKEMALDIFDLLDLNLVDTFMRFVGKQSVLGDGFGMGPAKFIAQCASYGVTITPALAKKSVAAYRKKNKPVVDLWYALEEAAINAVKNPTKKFTTNKTTWFMKKRFLCCKLPSGRCLYYIDPAVVYQMTPWGKRKAVLTHMGLSPTKKWVRQKTWGGVLTENVVQAVARDIMAASMNRVVKHDYEVVLTVHDEILAENDIGKGSVKEFEQIMSIVPKWAKGCPVAAEGWQGFRYRK